MMLKSAFRDAFILADASSYLIGTANRLRSTASGELSSDSLGDSATKIASRRDGLSGENAAEETTFLSAIAEPTTCRFTKFHNCVRPSHRPTISSSLLANVSAPGEAAHLLFIANFLAVF